MSGLARHPVKIWILLITSSVLYKFTMQYTVMGKTCTMADGYGYTGYDEYSFYAKGSHMSEKHCIESCIRDSRVNGITYNLNNKECLCQWNVRYITTGFNNRWYNSYRKENQACLLKDDVENNGTYLYSDIGDNVKIKCNINATKPSKYNWLKNGNPLKHRTYIPYGNENRTELEIRDVRMSDRGNYSCNVTNSYGNETMSMMTTLSVQDFSTTKPEIHIMKDQTVNGSAEVEVDCKLKGETTGVEFRWLKNMKWFPYPLFQDIQDKRATDERINTLPYFKDFTKYAVRTSTGSKLILSANLTRDMKDVLSGMYTCLAFNRYGHWFTSMILKVVPREVPTAVRPTIRPSTKGPSGVLISKRWILQNNNLCFGPDTGKFSLLRLQTEGILKGMKFVHNSGFILCKQKLAGPSYWGCAEDLVSVVITDSKDRVIMPDYVQSSGWSSVTGYSSLDKTLVLIDDTKLMYAFKGQVIKVYSSYGNSNVVRSGLVCSRVYAMFE